MRLPARAVGDNDQPEIAGAAGRPGADDVLELRSSRLKTRQTPRASTPASLVCRQPPE